MRRWKRRNTQVDAGTVDRDAGTSSLRTQTISDVHLGHDLDARDKGHADGLGQDHHFLQHPIYPIAHRDSGFARLEMDVASARRDSLSDYVIYEFDYWALCFLLIQPALAVVGLLNYRLNRGFSGPIEELADPVDRRVN